MITLELLRSRISSAIIWERCAFNRLDEFGGILMAADDVTPDRHHIYVGDADGCCGLLERAAGPFTLLCAGDGARLRDASLPPDVNVIVTDMTLRLYNRLFQTVTELNRLESAFRCAVRQDSGLQSAAESFCRSVGGSLAIVNEGFRRTALLADERDMPPLLRPIAENGYMPFTLSHIYQQRSVPLGNGRAGFYRCEFPQDGFHYLERRINAGGELVLRLIFASRQEQSLCFADMADTLAAQIEEQLAESGEGGGLPGESVNSFLADLIERRIVKHSEIADRQLNLPKFPIKNHFMLALLGFVNYSGGIPWNYIREQLYPIFPSSLIGFYKKQFVLLIPMASYIERPEYDRKALMELLEYFDAYFVEGDHANLLDTLPFLFFQAETTLRIAPKIPRPGDTRIFRFDHYRVYMMIEMMCSAGFKTYHDGSLYFLASHGYTMVVRYDRKYGTDLEKTLAVYMEENCNTSSTAQRMFLHRNSVINRITKIEELIGESLKDPMVIEQLRFSVHVKDYIERYLGESFPGRDESVPQEIDDAILDI